MKTTSLPESGLGRKRGLDKVAHATSPPERAEPSKALLHEMLLKDLQERAQHPLVVASFYTYGRNTFDGSRPSH